ncbi:hypothetical protein ACVIQT_009889 [Bradyrhizobium diazoefficiens]
MTIKRNCMTKADAVIIAAIEAGVPSLVEARALVDQFHDMIRKKDEAKLDVWIANAKTSLVSSLATGVLKDRAAVRGGASPRVPLVGQCVDGGLEQEGKSLCRRVAEPFFELDHMVPAVAEVIEMPKSRDAEV